MVSSEAFKKRISRSKGATKLKVFSRERAVSISLTRTARQKKAGSERSTGVSIPAVYSLPVIGSRVTWVHRAFSALSIFALVGPLIMPSVALSSPGYLMGPVNLQITGALQLSISGSASATPYVGGANQQYVTVDWGEMVGGNPARDTFSIQTASQFNTVFSGSGSNKSFVTSWTPVSHIYSSAGLKTILVKVHHSNFNGNEGDASEFTTEVFVPPAALNVIKHVVNIGGGDKVASDFTIHVSGINPSPSTLNGSEAGIIVSIDAGTYLVSEDPVTNYISSFSSDCSSSIASGQTKTCTITNTFTSEPPPPPSPQCSDGTDNDGDGKTDFPADPGCVSVEDNDEIDSPPPPPSPQCSDGTDNDSDGKIDYPSDPGCADASDNDETDPPPPPPDPEDDLTECSNEIDDDDDGLIDLDDPGCVEFAPKITVMKILTNDNTGTAELSAFSFFVDLIEVFLGTPTVFGPGSHAVSETGPGGYTASFSGDCAPDGIVSLDIGESATCTVTNDDIDYPQCSDGIDNDDDGDIDYDDDLGCSSSEDDDESDDPAFPQCSDGVDNDGDGYIDGVDSGCANAEDNDENTPPVITIDTELVELTLHSSFDPLSGVTVTDVEDDPDPSVVVGGDTVNTSATGTYVVVYDAVDSDGAAAEQKTRTINVVSPECSDGTDNDQDGKTDYPADPGCSSASDDDETNAPPPPPPSPQCSDGIDNDQDGLIDMVDPGCTDSSDNDETNTTGGGDSGGGGGSSESSGSGGGGNGPILSLPGDNTSGGGGGGIVLPSGLVLGAAAEDNLPEGGSAYLDIYIKRGASNDPEKVKKLQSFLNREMGANIPITGFYGPLSYIWVEKFQVKYWEEVLKPWVPHGLPTDHTPTGYVYKTTRRWINMLNCPELNLPIPP